jgi:hypothetical protein
VIAIAHPNAQRAADKIFVFMGAEFLPWQSGPPVPAARNGFSLLFTRIGEAAKRDFGKGCVAGRGVSDRLAWPKTVSTSGQKP